MADVEDPKFELDKLCLEKHCVAQHSDYRKCLARIKQIPEEKEPHCWGWYNEVIHCVDHCTDKKLWPQLK